MPLLRFVENHDYRPEYGTIVVRDVPRPDRVRRRVGELLAEYAVDTQPSGSFTRAGDGWLEGVARRTAITPLGSRCTTPRPMAICPNGTTPWKRPSPARVRSAWRWFSAAPSANRSSSDRPACTGYFSRAAPCRPILQTEHA
jgi:hypothetical protein